MPDNSVSVFGRISAMLKGDGLRAQILRGGMGSVVVKVAALGFSLMVAVVLARTLGPEGYGIYSYTFALISVLAIPAQFGLPSLVIRETAKAHAKQQWGLMRGIWRWSNGVTLLLSGCLALLAGVAAWLWSDNFTDVQKATFMWGIFLIPLISLGNLRGAALRGLRHIVAGLLPEFVIRPALFLLALLVSGWVLGGAVLTPAYAMALHVAAAASAFGIGAVLLWKARPQPFRETTASIRQSRDWLKAALPMAVIAGMSVVNTQADIIMLGLFSTKEDVGIYRVAATGASLVSFGLVAISMVTLPYFARFYARDDMAAFRNLATTSARAMFAMALPAAILFVFFGDSLLKFVFGEGYVDAYMPLILLAIAHLIHAAFGTVGPLLNMTGHEKKTAKSIVIAAGCNIILNLILIPPYGMSGAASATAITFLIWNYMLWREVRIHLNTDSSILNLPKRHHQGPGWGQ